MGKEYRATVDYILQLHLNRLRKSGSEDPKIQIVWLTDQLLEVIAENLADETSGKKSFRSQLEGLRRKVLESSGISMSGMTALSALDLCRDQFRLEHIRRMERDRSYAEIIAFLRKSLASLTGDSRTFHEDLLETTDRIKELVDLKDVQELKTRIAAEVHELQRTVQEKQKREQGQFAQLSEQIAGLQKKLEEAKAEASLDGLTGIANRRNFDFTFQRWVVAHDKSEEPFTVALLDLDSFKHVNDNYGHQIGDQVLISTAVEIQRNIRASDYLARYGGEEFVVLSSGMKLPESQKRFSALLKKIENMQIECKSADNKKSVLSVTASCGVAEYALNENAADLIRRADEALYEAKRAGKNQVVTKRRPLLSAFYEGRKRNVVA
jgi:diguanylate cyclase